MKSDPWGKLLSGFFPKESIHVKTEKHKDMSQKPQNLIERVNSGRKITINIPFWLFVNKQSHVAFKAAVGRQNCTFR